MELLAAAWSLTFVAEVGLEVLQARSLARHGDRIPPELDGIVDGTTLRRMTAYARDRARLRVARSIAGGLAVGGVLFGGGLRLLDAALRRPGSPDHGTNDLLWVARASIGVTPHLAPLLIQGVEVVVVLVVLGTLLDLPFAWWGDFRIEARYGFHRATPGLWLSDRLKGLLLAAVLGITVATAGLALVWWSPHHWWVWAWALFVTVSILLLLAMPVVIEPWFFEFKPVADPALAERVRELATHAGLRVGRILQVNASRRSRHSNAYFTGIGRVKRIVLFDTLVETHQPEEIEAVLAHEIGHWKLRHVLRRLLAQFAVLFAALWVAGRLARWPGLSELAGRHDMTFPVRAVLLAILASFLSLPLSPFVSSFSRRDERQADRYAVRLTGRPTDLARALQRMARDNLMNLFPHPLYAWVHATHPPVLERIRAVRAMHAAEGADP